MKSKSPEEKAEAIASLIADGFIEEKNYDSKSEDDLVEIISNAWVNAGNNKDAINDRLLVLMPVSISHIMSNGDRLARLAERIAFDAQDEKVIAARKFKAEVKPVNPSLPGSDRIVDTTPTKKESIIYDAKLRQYNEDTLKLEEYKKFLAPYDEREAKFKKIKAQAKFSDLHEKIYNEVKRKQSDKIADVNADSEVEKVDKIQEIKNHIGVLNAEAVKLGREGSKEKQKAIESITREISRTIYQCSEKKIDPVLAFEKVEILVDRAIPILNKSFINDLRNFIAQIVDLFNSTTSTPILTDSAKQMTIMKQKLNELFPPSPDEDNTPNPNR